MARNSRFRTTSGPTSGRPQPGKKKFRDDKKSDSPSSFRGKKSFPSGGPDSRRSPKNEERSRPGNYKKSYPSGGPGSRRSPKGEEESRPGNFKKHFKKEGPSRWSERGKFQDKGRGEGKGRSERPGSPERDERKRGREGARPQRPFYKQGFGRRDETREGSGDKRYKSRPSGEKGRSERPDRKERKSFVESRLERQRKYSKPSIHKEAGAANPDGLIRLNKFISNSGVCSRREADDLIAMGLITVNGKSITELGYKVKPTDDVRYEGRRLKAEPMVYILLNKPKGYITTTEDPQERNTVMQLIQGACKERVYPVGRLDRNTSGLLLLTNDGELTDKLTHPSYNVKKIYKAELDKPLTKNDFQKIQAGVELEEGKAMVDDLAVISEDGKTVGIEIHIGWNRVIRRIFEVLGYEVVKLDRSVYATLDKKDLPRGHWRFLRQDEIIRLKHFQ
ncbi:MAG: pseudouridine synthase [Cyclobacteriaceae bacterium]|nr:pseudouridine synthase [Cyclobacteriaceae bacterium]